MAEATKTWTILEVLDWTRGHFQAKGLDSPRLDAELLIAHALGLQRIMLYARFDQPLSAEELATIRKLVGRRARGEPMAYLLGEKEFWSLPFEVDAAVLIPRPDSEALVEEALARLAGQEAPRIADVGTGSGCIAVALAHQLPQARVWALDRSPAACEVARRNAERNGVAARVTVLESDLLAALPADARPLSLIAANLPYIPTGDLAGLMRDVRDFEPRSALDGGADGLELVRRLISGSGGALAPGGALALEIGHDQAAAARALLAAAGFVQLAVRKDAAGIERVVSGQTAC